MDKDNDNKDRPANSIKIQTRLLVSAIVVALIIGVAYWLAVKPALIRHDCNKGAVKYAESYGNYNQNLYVTYYNECVELKGLTSTIPVGQPIPVD